MKDPKQPTPRVDADSSANEEPLYGVYAPSRPRRVLHSEIAEFKTETMRSNRFRDPLIPADLTLILVGLPLVILLLILAARVALEA